MTSRSIDTSTLALDELLTLQAALDGILFAPILKRLDPLKVTAQVEAQLAKGYMQAWQVSAGGALADNFRELVATGGAPMTQARIDSFAARMGVSLKKPLTPRQVKLIDARVRKAYEISKKATQVQELKVKPSFSLRDTKAIKWIAREQVLWMGDFYSSQLSERIRAVTSDALLTQGLSNREAGRALQREMGVRAGGKTALAAQVPARYAGEEGVELYFRQLASVASQRARVWSKISAYHGAGVISYRLTNPNDRRTGQICQQMSGQVFTVQTGVDHVERMMNAKTPDEVKAVQPWISGETIAADMKAAGNPAKGSDDATRVLQERGAILPPFHPLCRTEPVILSRKRPQLAPPAPAKPVVPKPKPGAPKPAAPAARIPLPPRARVPQPLPKGITDAQLAELTPAEIEHMWGGWSLEKMPLATEVDVQAATKAIAQVQRDIKRATDAIKKLASEATRDRLVYGMKGVKTVGKGLSDFSWDFAGDEAVLKRISKSLLKPDSKALAKIESWPKGYLADLRRNMPDQAINSMASEGYTIEGVAKSRMRRDVLGTHFKKDSNLVDGGTRRIRRILIRKGLKKAGPEVNAGETQVHVVVHEFAHGIDRGVLDDAMNKFWAKLRYERVTWYAEESVKEDVAESIAGALVKGDIAKKMSERAVIRYRIVKNMFRNDESYRRGLVIFSKFGETTYSFDEALAALEAL
jgi:hypothetical protein